MRENFPPRKTSFFCRLYRENLGRIFLAVGNGWTDIEWKISGRTLSFLKKSIQISVTKKLIITLLYKQIFFHEYLL